VKKGVNYTGISIVFFCHDEKDNYLLNKRSKKCRDEHGCWDCGGGALEFRHDAIQTLKKEVKEEYCADVLQHQFLGFRDIRRTKKGDKTHWIALDFKVLINRQEVKNGEPHKFDKIKWFKLDELPKPLHSQLKIALKKYKNKL